MPGDPDTCGHLIAAGCWSVAARTAAAISAVATIATRLAIAVAIGRGVVLGPRIARRRALVRGEQDLAARHEIVTQLRHARESARLA